MKKLLSILLLTFVIGCATPYQETSKWNWTTGGYSDTKIQADVFKVSFSGSKQTSTSLSESFALLRAAEVVLREGYRYFIVMDDQSGRVRRGAGILWTPFAPTIEVGSSATLTVKAFVERPETLSPIVHDAEQVSTNIRRQHGVK